MVIEATVCHIIRGNELLLKKANRGISVGKWNAPGGKLERGESPEGCARREVQEETGLAVSELFYHGVLTFVMDGGKAPDMLVHLFSTSKAGGRAKSGEEGPVKWFPLDALPFEEMWEDDLFWIPLMLRRVRFNATFAYDAANRHVTRFEFTLRQRYKEGRRGEELAL